MEDAFSRIYQPLSQHERNEIGENRTGITSLDSGQLYFFSLFICLFYRFFFCISRDQGSSCSLGHFHDGDILPQLLEYFRI